MNGLTLKSNQILTFESKLTQFFKQFRVLEKSSLIYQSYLRVSCIYFIFESLEPIKLTIMKTNYNSF